MIEKGLPLTAVDTILSLAKSVHNHKFTVRGIVQGALMTNLEAVRSALQLHYFQCFVFHILQYGNIETLMYPHGMEGQLILKLSTFLCHSQNMEKLENIISSVTQLESAE